MDEGLLRGLHEVHQPFHGASHHAGQREGSLIAVPSHEGGVTKVPFHLPAGLQPDLDPGIAGHIRWREIVPLLPFSAIGVLMGLYLFKTVDAVMLAHALGVFVLLFALYTLFIKDAINTLSRRWALPAGLLGGLVGTLFGTGGPFYVIYLKHRGLPKSQFRATFATIFLLDGAGRLTGYLGGGFFDRDWLILAAGALPVMAVGLYLGGNIHTNISQRSFQVAVSSLLVISGFSLLLRH